jgi:Tol biopolymer transport system component
VVLTIASSVAIAVLVVGMGIAGVRALQTAPTPADPPTPIPATLGFLAYGLDGDIYVAEWDGSNPVRIADGRPDCGHWKLGEYFGWGAMWSPDGRYVAYRRVNCDDPFSRLDAGLGGWSDVVISDPVGNVVASFPSDGWRISWSADSTRVAVWVRFGRTIGVYGLDGVRQALLTAPTEMLATSEADPVWSPDGESLVVAHGVEIPLDGRAPRKLPWADGPWAPGSMSWVTTWETYSPDGSRVAYSTRRSLVVAEADGSTAQEMFKGVTTYPLWSPTGDRIAFISSHQLHVLDVATGRVTLLTEADGSDWRKAIAFSPDGDRILIARNDVGPDRSSSLWSINADGTDLRRLVTGTTWGDWLSPSPTP